MLQQRPHADTLLLLLLLLLFPTLGQPARRTETLVSHAPPPSLDSSLLSEKHKR